MGGGGLDMVGLQNTFFFSPFFFFYRSQATSHLFFFFFFFFGGGVGGRGGEEGVDGAGLRPFQDYYTYIKPIVHQR